MYVKLIIVFSFFIALISCSSASSQNTALPDYSSVAQTDTSSAQQTYEVLDSADIQEIPIAHRIAQAESLCTQSRFLEADSVLRTTLAIIDSIDESDADSVPAEQYIDTILNVYTLMMPPEFLPDAISLLQFNRQMQVSLDSLGFSSEDSALISKLISRKDISFDVPMVWNEKVVKALSYYIRSKPGTINRWLERASFYLPVMKQMFADSGLPQDLAYLPLIESGFNAQAYSRARAAGIWQFIASTGNLYGLRHSYWFDERRDPLKSTASAIRYLKKLYGDFGNWHLALAAYNCGEGGVGRAIAKSGTTDYWELPLPKETKNYVPCYLAALTIAKNPDLFNFTPDSTNTFTFDTVQVSECVDMRDIADELCISFDDLKKNNPHITHWCTPPDVSNVRLYLPVGTAEQFACYIESLPDEKKVKWYAYKVRRGDTPQSVARRFKVSVDAIREINQMTKKSRITAGKMLYIPIPTKGDMTVFAETAVEPATSTPKKAVSSSDKIKYKVKKGDTVSDIALMFDVTMDEIEDWNNLSHSRISAGQILKIYSDKPSEKSSAKSADQDDIKKYRVQEGDSPYSIALKFGLALDDFLELNDLDKSNPVIKIDEIVKVYSSEMSKVSVSKKTTQQSGNFIQYSVSPGDNLYRIAQNFSIPLDELMRVNDLAENDKIRVGDMIKIPRSETSRVRKSQELSANVVYYQVKQGDNLWNIAETFGIPIQSLLKLNDLNKDSVIMPGDTLKVAKAGQM